MFATIKNNFAAEIPQTCSDCSIQGTGVGCYIPQKYDAICCDNPGCLILQCRCADVDCATLCPAVCAADALCGTNGKCGFAPVCLDGCVKRDCDCDLLCKKCPFECDPRVIQCCLVCSLISQERCGSIDCAPCCPEALVPWCALCGACAARDCGMCIDKAPPQCAAVCPPCKLCQGKCGFCDTIFNICLGPCGYNCTCGEADCSNVGSFCAYRLSWLPAQCCCKNCGVLCAFPGAPKLCSGCNEMTAADKGYKWGAAPPPLGSGMPTVRGPNGNPINFAGDDGPAKSAAAVAPSS